MTSKFLGSVVFAGIALSLVASGAQADVTISAKPTSNMTCTAGVCSPTAAQAVLNKADLSAMLAAADVTVTTGSGATSIVVATALNWVSPNRLTLDANRSVTVRAKVVVVGPGGFTVATNDGGTGGDLVFLAGGSVDFWDLASSLVVNGTGFTLVKTLPALRSAIQANRSGDFALARNYNAAGHGVYNASPIAKFGGTFEGLGHTISNLSIDYAPARKRSPPAAMFADSTGTLRDISLADVSVTSTTYAGGLVGTNTGSVIQAHASGTITGGNASGGIAGQNNGTILRSDSAANVTATGIAGGLSGINAGTIDQSSASGAVKAIRFSDAWAGGLVGFNASVPQTGTITHSYSTGTVYGVYAGDAGGLVGENSGIVTLSHSNSPIAMGDQFGAGRAGGLVATNGYQGVVSQSYATGTLSNGGGGLVGENSGLVLQSYATGAVTADIAGGLAETNEGTISQAYSTGSVYAYYGAGYLGGFIGYDDEPPGASITAAYWDTDTSGISNPSQGAGNVADDPGITGLSSAALSHALPSGFDPSVWGRKRTINGGMPYLLANPPQ